MRSVPDDIKSFAPIPVRTADKSIKIQATKTVWLFGTFKLLFVIAENPYIYQVSCFDNYGN